MWKVEWLKYEKLEIKGVLLGFLEFSSAFEWKPCLHLCRHLSGGCEGFGGEWGVLENDI